MSASVNILEISSKEFEEMVRSFLKRKKAKLKDLEIIPNVKMKAYDAKKRGYQIDIKVSFSIFDFADIVALIECKRSSYPIKRRDVESVHTRLLSIGAHKGIIFSTASFQEGACEFAEAHGITLVEVRGKRTYTTILHEPRVIYNKSSLDQLEIDSYGCEYIYHDINRNKTIQVFDEDNLHTLGIFLFGEIDSHYAGSIPGLAPLN